MQKILELSERKNVIEGMIELAQIKGYRWWT